MNLVEKEGFSSEPSEDDFLIREVVLTHDPDGRYLDSELLLQAVEDVLCSTATADVSDPYDDATIIEVVGSEESLEQIIYKVSSEMLLKCCGDSDLHTKTMVLLQMLGKYTWDAKAVIILAALAMTCGDCWLIKQLYPYNYFAASAGMLKQFPSDLNLLGIQFKALSMLANTMVELAKCVIKYERLPMKEVHLDYNTMALTKTQIYVATYRIFKGSLEFSAQTTDFVAMNQEKCMISQTTTIAAWGLSYMVPRLRRLCNDLLKQVDSCHDQTETKQYKELSEIFSKPHNDNQEVFQMLFALKDEIPLKDCSSQAQVNIFELEEKVVLILVSTPEVLPVDQIHFLEQRTHNHHYHKKIGRNYEIVWVPFPTSDTWTILQKRNFNILSKSLPCLCIRKPWLLNSAVLKFIRQEWNYKKQYPLMVALDSQGMVSHYNAMDMVFIWGAKAFPFSTSKEKELWGEQSWSLKLLLDGVDPLLMKRVEEGSNICLYGGDDLYWTKEFTSRLDEIRAAGLNFEVIKIDDKSPSVYDPHKLIQSKKFWLRLGSMKRSILCAENTAPNHRVLKEVLWLLEMNNTSKSWVLIGNKNSEDVLKLQEMEAIECLDLFPVWKEYVGRMGLVRAIKTAFQPNLSGGP
ncbi:protein SIEVE ELEMENT OCCLUSION C isoform X3 [Daucus carota subsp. sativus]|uniref:protein SIEVE ELEMENT OCCLUSION C isoform X3 n=1 Tax=Daucus carota subsp. sativus TaxID=79200 RepID=UPI0007F00CB2|nr:PREDICTED: protein SIEVE ELEMENT OCCLUSION C [Daucus carota subsp. sativus]